MTSARTPLGEQFQAKQVAGELRLQRCTACGAFQYPTREVCRACLSDTLTWDAVARGVVTSTTRLHTTNEPVFQPLLPLSLVSIRVEGTQVVAFAVDAAASIGTEVALAALKDDDGRFVVCAIPVGANVPPNGKVADILKARYS